MLRFAGAGLIYTLLALLGRAAWLRGREALHSAFVGTNSLALQFGCGYFAAARGVNMGLIALVTGMIPIVTALLGLASGIRCGRCSGWGSRAASQASPSRSGKASASTAAPALQPTSPSS